MQSPRNQCSQDHIFDSPSGNSSSSTPSTQRSLPTETHQRTPTFQGGLASNRPTPSVSSKSSLQSPCAAATQTRGTPAFHNTPSPGYNPFESANENLLVTPGLFQIKVPSPTQEGRFYWEFEQSALLNPTDMGDDVRERLVEQERRAKKYEQAIEAASNEFWRNHHVIAASPSPPDVQLSQKRIHHMARIDEELMSVCNASCQTDIHLPPSLDVQQLFKDHMLSASQVEELNKGDSFSNSSLRRKLFDNSEGSSDSNPSTPEKSFSPLDDNFLHSPPLNNLHSSSPVFGNSDEHLSVRRRCSLTQSIDSDNLSPPDLSPISSPAPTNSCNGMNSLPTDLSMIYAIPKQGSPGRLCLTDGEESDGAEADSCIQEMSINQQSVSRVEVCADRDELMLSRPISIPPLQDIDTASMCSIEDNSRMHQSSEFTGASFNGPSACDTGYQSQSASRYFMDDLSTIQEIGRHESQTHKHNKPSPHKPSPSAWTPPSSSTPTKAPLGAH